MLKNSTPQETKALQKCMNLCSQREYCENDIYEKLEKLEITGLAAKKIVDYLVDQKYIDHNRFLTAFINDKLKFNHWGKTKIRYYLKQKNIDNATIQRHLLAIDETDYLKIVNYEIDKKRKLTSGKDTFEKNQKIARSMISKGFEPSLVFDLLKFT